MLLLAPVYVMTQPSLIDKKKIEGDTKMGKGPVICLCWRTQYTARNNS
jgi:hypothetical protein